MKHILLALLFTIAPSLATSQDHPYRVVFDLTSPDSLNQMALTGMIKSVSETSPDAEIEVVMYGKGFELVMPGKSHFATDVETALKNPRVTFSVCEMAMKKHNVDKSMFMSGVRTVPDGIKELVMKQQEGWGYIKVAR